MTTNPNTVCPRPQAVKAVRGPVQLTRRVRSTSVTVITPGAGCSITSTATVSTARATGCFTFRATFFTGATLGLAFATVGFVRGAPTALLSLTVGGNGKKLPTGAEQPLGTIVDSHAPGEAPPAPHLQSLGVGPRLLSGWGSFF
jgi:hypothetical protein